MAGFADLVQQAQPALVGGGVHVEGTAGADWEWEFEGVVDNNGDDIDLSTATGACVISNNGADVATLTFTGGDGSFTVGLAATATADLNADSYTWSLVVTLSGTSVQFWGRSGSRFVVRES